MNPKILITNLDTVDHNYGSQAIALPLAQKLKERFGAELTFVIGKRFVVENEAFFTKQGWQMLVEPNPITAMAKISFFYKRMEILRETILTIKGKSSQAKNEQEDLQKFEENLRNFDLVVDANGIEFVGNLPAGKRSNQFLRVNFIQALARINKIKYIKYTKSYGPFDGSLFRRAVKRQLNKLPFVLVRSGENLEQVKALKLDIPVYSYPDISLVLEPASEVWANEYLTKKGIDSKKSIVGISPSAVIAGLPNQNTAGQNHLVLCVNLIQEFAKNEQVIILPHALGEEKNPARSDLVLARKIYEPFKNNPKVIFLDDLSLTYAQVRAIIGRMNFYVAARFHAIASALYMGTPVVPMSWHVKYRDLMGLFIDKFPVVDSRINISQAFNLIKKFKQNQGWFDKMKLGQRKKMVLKRIDQSMDLIEKVLNEK